MRDIATRYYSLLSNDISERDVDVEPIQPRGRMVKA